MGTTVVALALVPEEPDPDDDRRRRRPTSPQHLLIANVGDSRGYLFRDGSLTQLTEDHSVVADLVREGRITSEEAEVHPQRNIVTRVLGVYEIGRGRPLAGRPGARATASCCAPTGCSTRWAPIRSAASSAASTTRARRPPSWCAWPTRAGGETTSPPSSSTCSTTAACRGGRPPRSADEPSGLEGGPVGPRRATTPPGSPPR